MMTSYTVKGDSFAAGIPQVRSQKNLVDIGWCECSCQLEGTRVSKRGCQKSRKSHKFELQLCL